MHTRAAANLEISRTRSTLGASLALRNAAAKLTLCSRDVILWRAAISLLSWVSFQFGSGTLAFAQSPAARMALRQSDTRYQPLRIFDAPQSASGEKDPATETLPGPTESPELLPENASPSRPAGGENQLFDSPRTVEPGDSIGRGREAVPGERGATPRSTDGGTTGQAEEKNSSNASSTAATTDPHAACFEETLYPSAKKCAECHEQIYEEWASSSHAYSAISPMFHKFEQKISDLSQGTIGYFCMRCHSQVGTTIGHPRERSIWEAIPAAREGVTCIVCHRVKEQYNKVNGERRIEPGDLYQSVTGSGSGEKLAEVIAAKDKYKVKVSDAEKGPSTPIHTGVYKFEQITRSDFCVSCHQVAVHPGIKLEVVWDQYIASPAYKRGITCQDCHMGRIPGKASGYSSGPVAIIAGKPIDPERKHSNHSFYGPGYSIAHPGVFPFNPKADKWTPQQWLEFDYRADWGKKAFEDDVADGKIKLNFPQVWKESDDRADAREILEANLKKLERKHFLRKAVMENAFELDGPYFKKPPRTGEPLTFWYTLKNVNQGHNAPSGSLGAQPQIWLNVALTDPLGQRLWESGYLDTIGDMADLHSQDVLTGKVPYDKQLLKLQTMFLVTNVKGTDREFPLPINMDIDQIPFIRPGATPNTVMNHPPFLRMEAHTLPPLATRKAHYEVAREKILRPGKYKLSARMRSRSEPIYFMRFCGSTLEMERTMNERMLDFHETCVELEIR